MSEKAEQNGGVPGIPGEELTEDQQLQAGIDQGTLDVIIILTIIRCVTIKCRF